MNRGKYILSLLDNTSRESNALSLTPTGSVAAENNFVNSNNNDGGIKTTKVSNKQYPYDSGTASPAITEELLNVDSSNLYDSDDSIKDKNYEYSSDDKNSTDSDSEKENDEQKNMGEVNQVKTYTGRPKKGRKRKYTNQDRKIRKRKCNSNEVHYTAKGKLKEKKQFIDFQCTCRNKCFTKISVEARQHFFNKYWELADYNVQTTFLSSHIREEGVKRKGAICVDPNKRNFSRTYTINKLPVCRDMFIKTLNISTKRINTSLRKVRNLAIPDKRGIAGGHNRMTVDQKNAVVNHINKFPRYKSHYCRARKNDQEFLPIGVTLPLMYKLYKEENQDCLSISACRKIFLTEFNLKVKLPKKDTCNRCDTYKAKSQNCTDEDQKALLSSDHNLHLDEAACARSKMEADIEKAVNDDTLETLTFDMEKTLPLPRLSTNIIFYKRQLWLYNCGIFAAKLKKSLFNIWIEGQAGRGSQEVGSCLRKYITNHLNENVTRLILWSDSCGGQNRNIKMVLLLKCILEENQALESIQLCFLISGHSFLPNDSDFGGVECALKRQQKLYSPQDYVEVMKTCRRKNKITVSFMKKDDFVSTAGIEKEITNRKKDTNEEKINWLYIKEIKVVKDKPHNIFIKNTHNVDESYKEINIKKKQGRPPSAGKNFSPILKCLWPTGKPVAQAKLDDIDSYMHLIPLVDQGFYKNLTGDATIEEDIDGFNGPLDFEIEEAQ